MNIRWLAFLLTCLPTVGQVVINELHCRPDIKQERVRFVELHNPGATNVPLGGWAFTSGIRFEFAPGTEIPAEGYLVIAEDPAALAAKFSVPTPLGPWTGQLSGSGETVTLSDETGRVVDEVDYQVGFPWPTVGDSPGYSLELIHPRLDNSLGGNWRPSTTGETPPELPALIESQSVWRYFPATQAPAGPVSNAAQPGFDDSAWSVGRSPVGYDPAVNMGTPLSDMRGSYRQFFLRGRFAVTNAAGIRALRLEVLFDDGFKFWLNGTELLAVGLPLGDVPVDVNAVGAARESNAFEGYDLVLPPNLLRDGENVVAVQVANVDIQNSSDCFLDLRLRAASAPQGFGPTPGQPNRTLVSNAPPAIRQVRHVPEQPQPGEPTVITAKVTDPDGVTAVVLEYQAVLPGSYLELGDEAYQTNWTALPMGVSADDSDVFVAALPVGVIQHRHLIRYRVRATDGLGATVRAPYADDPQPNFALFVYGGVPAWTGAIRPGAAGAQGTPFTVDAAEMNRLPTYHLIAKKDTVEACTWRDRSHGDEYFWTGTLVYDGKVYDHIRMRPRGGVWRYAMGKNMWKFDFNRGHDFEPRDNWGRKLGTAWTKLNLGACIQQGDFGFRGEQGLFESVGFRLFQLTGQPAMHSAFVQFRIIDEVTESDPQNQFGGDFWGIYLALEQPDGRFLDEHGLPDGNLYKMEGGGGDANNLGPDGPVDESDLIAFQNAYQNQLPTLDETWWRNRFNLPAYYSYQTIVQAIHHYDIADGKNYFFYHRPDNGQWMTIVWDLDLTWADGMYRSGQQGGDEPFKSRVLSGFSTASPRYPNLSREFRNRVREVRDLLWNDDEVIRLIDEYVRLLRGTNGNSIVDADRAQWDYNPVMASGLVNPSKAGQGRFYQFPLAPGVSKSFAGAAEWMKRYVGYRATNATFSLDTISREPERPARPALNYSGPAGFPVNRLVARASAYSGLGAFGSTKFRVAEVTRPDHPAYRPGSPLPYEITPVWESGEITDPAATVTVPQEALRVGRLYRARVRHTDAEGRASNWSAPLEFTAGEPDTAAALIAQLKLSELMYHPADDGFEFLELRNASDHEPLRLDGANFTDGIDFTFPENSTLQPGEHAVLIGTTNRGGFSAYHRLDPATPLFGPFEGNLANGGETLTLKTSAGGSVIFSLVYDDAEPWPTAADGQGYSLVPADIGISDLSSAGFWRASRLLGGSPGKPDTAPVQPILLARPESLPAGLRIQLQAEAAQLWVLEASDDLAGWVPQATNTGPITLTLPYPAGSVPRFFRAVPR